MRIWSLHPHYLDSKGLVALWREGLLALAVLKGNTRGYRHHPQLERFRGTRSPVNAMKCYLWAVLEEARARGYHFNPAKIRGRSRCAPIMVTTGQLRFEVKHLKQKLRTRQPAVYAAIRHLTAPVPHPLLVARPGGVEDWERARREDRDVRKSG